MAEGTKYNVTKLNNTNFSNWKFRMELLLTKEKSWYVITGDPPVLAADNSNAVVVENWKKSDGDARASIGLSIDDDQIIHIRAAKTAKEAWNNLKNYHEKSTLSNKVHLMRTICSLKANEGANVAEHVNQMNELFVKLRDIGEEALSDKWSVAMLLSSLPRSYDGLITALEARAEEDLTYTLVQQKVIAEYERRSNAGESSDTALKVTTGPSQGVCFFCKMEGHQKRQCSKYIEWKSKKDAKEKAKNRANAAEEKTTDFMYSTGNIKGGWILDSGATRHVVNYKQFFTELDESYQGEIEVASGELVKVNGIGRGKLTLIDNSGSINTAEATEVLYAPKMTGNLLSVSSLVKMGFNVVFQTGLCEIKFGNKQVAVADSVGGLYKLRAAHKVNSADEIHHKVGCIHQWHRLLGHRDPEAIKKMQAEGLIEDLKIVECGVRMSCEVCLKGKATRLPFPKKSKSKSKAPGDLIHTDVCGPMSTATFGGNKYVVTFIDDFSRFTVICLLKHKDEVEQKLKNFVEFVETKFGRRPKVLRSDRGGEYIGKNVKRFLAEKGIQAHLTAGYSPEQNGVAERKNRALIEMSRCLLIDAQLPHIFWGEAIATATHIQNLCLTRSTEATPYELWNNKKPGTKHLKIFGTKCFVHTPVEKRKKLDNTAEEMIFIGYDNNSKAYRCYDLVSKRVIISRDVKFVENIAKFESTTTGERDSNQIEVNVKVENDTIENEEPTAEEQIENNIQEQEVEAIRDADGVLETPVLRRSQRENLGIPPRRLTYEMYVAKEGVIEPKSYKEAITCKNKIQWVKAMEEEMSALKRNNTWQLTDIPENRTAIGCKWVFKVKTDNSGEVQRFKARLVAQGFSQKYGIDYDEVFAPVVRQTTFRTLLSISAKEMLIVNHLDVETAFLNGQLHEEIYMKQPPGFIEGDTGKVCLLKKSLYGLKQAARAWNEVIHHVLINGGFQQSKVDRCLYSKSMDGNWCYVLIYVDDVITACKTQKQIEVVESLLKRNFQTQNLGAIRQYLQMKVTRDKDGNFELCQSKYIQEVGFDHGLQNAKGAKTPMEVNYGKAESCLLLDNKRYQSLIGSLLYISINTRPDITASVSILSQKVSNPTEEDWNQLKRVVKYLLATADMKLKLSNVKDCEGELVGYADANWAENKESRKSNSGYIFFLNGGTISWACRKQSCVALSSTEAEFISLSEASQEAQWLRRLLTDLHQDVNTPTVMNEDNQSCLKLIGEEKFSNRTKHIDTKVHFVKDYIDKKIIICVYCPTDQMIADLLTKPLSFVKHNELREKCNVI